MHASVVFDLPDIAWIKGASVSATLSQFQRMSACAAVQSDLKHEGTWPCGHDEGLLLAFLEHGYDDDGVADSASIATWNVDGVKATLEEAELQLGQHMKALKYAWSIPEAGLTLEIIKELHGILLRGATTKSGCPISAGTFRTANCHSDDGGCGTFVFAPAQQTIQSLI